MLKIDIEKVIVGFVFDKSYINNCRHTAFMVISISD